MSFDITAQSKNLSAESIPFDATAQSTTTSADRPELSRNAKAQVRRKAYIEQLERTVIMPQTVFALSPEQVFALPPQLCTSASSIKNFQAAPRGQRTAAAMVGERPPLTSYSHTRAHIL
ncbi:hypothetical protein EDB85DRAFT_2149743 [Lactarius pseudohatsudake]|nr:hypothetical protein EDB85DRAFT_2149743 [Lactarius pseudohatsudake]